MRRRPRQLLAPLALTLTALFAAAPLVSALHAEEHAHRWCAEHRALEESSAPTSSDAASALASGRAQKEAAGPQLAPAADAAAEDHVSCAVAYALLREAASLPAPASQPVPPAVTSRVPTQARTAERPPRLLFVAPKASPPFAG